MGFRVAVRGAILAMVASSCSGTTLTSPPTIPLSEVREVIVEVDYVPGAEPYVGGVRNLSDVWSLTRINMQRIYNGKSVTVPNTLAGMEKITDVTASVFSVDDVLAVARKHRTAKSGGSTVTFYVVFLDGYLKDDRTGMGSKDVLGVSIGDTGVVAMFKPVIQSSDLAGPAGQGVVAFVEQSTLTHELGHAIGLVNRSVPMVTAHQDTENGAHCTNTQCVMFWENEGAAAALKFAQRYLATGTELLFGEECLNDVDVASAAKVQ